MIKENVFSQPDNSPFPLTSMGDLWIVSTLNRRLDIPLIKVSCLLCSVSLLTIWFPWSQSEHSILEHWTKTKTSNKVISSVDDHCPVVLNIYIHSKFSFPPGLEIEVNPCYPFSIQWISYGPLIYCMAIKHKMVCTQ